MFQGSKRVAVLGGGLGGLVAAGELARAGQKVTLFEATQALGGKAGRIERDGFTLDTGPTLLTMPQVIRGAFDRLGATDLLPPLTELKLQCDYRWRDGARFDAWADLERTVDSAERLQPGEGPKLRAFYREAEEIYRQVGVPYFAEGSDAWWSFASRFARQGPKALLLGMRMSTLDAFARRHLSNEKLVQFAGRYATYAGASPYQASAAFAMIAHLERAEGVFHPRGGMGGLAAALGTALRRLGVEIRLGTKARFERRGAELIAGEQPFDAVVLNADPLAHLGRGDEPLALSGFVLLLEADRRLPLAHHSILFADSDREEHRALDAGRLPEDPTLYVCHPCATDSTLAPEGKSGLYLMVNAPPLGPGQRPWPEESERVAQWCIERLRAAFPDELRGVQLRELGRRTPLDLEALGAPRGSIYGFLPNGRLGPFRRPRQRAPEPGVFFAGGGTHPGGGVPLVMLSGQRAAAAVVSSMA